MVGPMIPLPAPQPVIDALTGAQVTTSAGQRSGFQLSFALSKASLLNTALLPAGYFDPGRRVILVATAGGFPRVLMDGVITRQEVTPSSEPGQSTLSVTGEDLTLLMELKQSSMLYPALPDYAIVNLVIAQYATYGIIPLVIPPVLIDVPVPTDKIESQAKTTDLSYLRTKAAQSGYVFYLIPGPAPGMSLAYWGPEVRIGVPQPALSVNMDAATNVESLSFSVDGLSRKQLVIDIQIPETKFSIPVPVPDVSLLRPPLALRPAPALRTASLPSAAKLNPVRAALRGLGELAGSSDAVTGSGQLDVLRYGQPLEARRLVGVRGAGLAYDGLYFVRSVTHTLRRGEYKQSFTLARDGLVSNTPRVPT
jgi:hypothetical protein